MVPSNHCCLMTMQKLESFTTSNPLPGALDVDGGSSATGQMFHPFFHQDGFGWGLSVANTLKLWIRSGDTYFTQVRASRRIIALRPATLSCWIEREITRFSQGEGTKARGLSLLLTKTKTLAPC